jgi:uncharacterized protein (DUF2062 family)
MNRLKTKIKNHFEEVFKTKTNPENIALGFSIGTFIGLLPLPFINLFIVFLIVLIFKKISKYTLLFSILFWNPIVQFPLTVLSYKVGDLIFGDSSVIKYQLIIVNHIINLSRRYLVGNMMVAFITSIIIYFLVFYIAKKIKK